MSLWFELYNHAEYECAEKFATSAFRGIDFTFLLFSIALLRLSPVRADGAPNTELLELGALFPGECDALSAH
ncbi:unnamed protein product, partial [Iphiclides podalirius]